MKAGIPVVRKDSLRAVCRDRVKCALGVVEVHGAAIAHSEKGGQCDYLIASNILESTRVVHLPRTLNAVTYEECLAAESDW